MSAGGRSAQPPTAGASTGDVAALPPGLDRRPAPRIRLADARGGIVDTRTLRGRPYVVTFLYVNCPDVCPLISQDLRTALGKLGPQGRRVAVVAVSVDPRGDTRPAVRAFLRRHRLPRNFHYGIGSERALTPIWRAYFAAPQVSGRPDSAHTAAVWFVDARGRWRGRMPAGTSVDSGVVARRLRALLREAA